MNGSQMLIALAIKHKGVWGQIYKDITSKNIEELVPYYEQFQRSRCKAVTILDSNYPQILKNIYMPPFVLFYYGDITLAQDFNKCLSIIGSREPSEYGIKMTTKLSNDLSNDFVIVSGMAKGIDGLAHDAAIKAGNKTVAILGCGVDVCYPPDNLELYEEIKKNHLLLSEYFGKVSPDAFHFPLRNRIIAGLSSATLIVEAKNNSGTSITASYALNFSRTIFAVPSNADCDSACNKLIREGAILVESAEDVLEDLSPSLLKRED